MLQVFPLSSFRNGIRLDNARGAYKYGYGLNVRKQVDTLSCQYGFRDETGTFDTPLVVIVTCESTGDTYGFSLAGRIYKRDNGLGTWTQVYASAGTLITGAAEWVDLNTGKFYLYWAEQNKLHRKALDGPADFSDTDNTSGWPKDLTFTNNHFMMPNVLGQLMICNDHNIAVVDEVSNFNASAFDVGFNHVASYLIERKNYVVIAANPRSSLAGQSKLVFWDGINAQSDKRIIPYSSISALIDTDVPLMYAGSGELCFSDSANTSPILPFPASGTLKPYAVENYNGLALFGTSTGCYAYGKIEQNQPRIFTEEYRITDTIQCIKRVGSNLLFGVGTNAATAKVKRVDLAVYQQARYESNDLPKPASLLARTLEYKQIVIRMKPLPSANCQIKAYYQLDSDGTWHACTLADGSTNDTYNTLNGVEAVFNIGEQTNLANIALDLIPYQNKTPEITSIEVTAE